MVLVTAASIRPGAISTATRTVTGTLMARQSVHHGVFDQRLQDQARHPHRGNLLGRRQDDASGGPRSAAAAAPSTASRIAVHRRAARIAARPAFKQPAQQIRELHDHGLRALRVPFDMAANRVQQIEQRVRR